MTNTTNQNLAEQDEASKEAERLSAAYDESGLVCRTHVGGQALIEGIMMRGRYNWALAVRKPDGSIYVEEHDLVSGKDKNSWMYKPVIRGCTAMVESLALGYKALEIAANHAFDYDEDEPGKEAASKEELQEAPEASKSPEEAASDELAFAATPPSDTAVSEPIAGEASTSAVEAVASKPAVEVADGGVAAEAPASDSSSTQAGASSKEQGTLEDAAEEQDALEAIVEVAKEEIKKEDALPKSLMTISMIVGILLGVGIFIPVLIEYLETGLVEKFPTAILSGFLVLAAINSFFAGLILDVLIQNRRQEFEIQLQQFAHYQKNELSQQR